MHNRLSHHEMEGETQHDHDDFVTFIVALGEVSDEAITAFFDRFAALLEDDQSFAPILAANDADVETARTKGRSTTRLVLSPKISSAPNSVPISPPENPATGAHRRLMRCTPSSRRNV